MLTGDRTTTQQYPRTIVDVAPLSVTTFAQHRHGYLGSQNAATGVVPPDCFFQATVVPISSFLSLPSRTRVRHVRFAFRCACYLQSV
jgi:hypothetical protein